MNAHVNAPHPIDALDRQAQRRPLPHDLECEASILGGIILRNDLLADIGLEINDFYHLPHKVVFEAMRNLEAADRPIDVVLLEHEIEKRDKTEALSGNAGDFLLQLALRVPTPDNVLHYRDTVLQLSRNRRAIIELSSATERAYNWPHDPSELIPEIAAQLTRIAESVPSTPKPAITGRTWGECVEEIYARKDEPWIDLRIGDVVIASCRNGSFVPLIAPSGAGKSTLGIQMLVDHAMTRGPAVYLTYELDGDEAVARAIGQHCRFSWASVLRGEVPRGLVPLVSRLRILERDNATLANLEKAIEALRKEYPDEPVFVVADYLQATPAPPGKERGYVANVSSELRKAAKKNRVVLIGVSQASTANSKAMRSGELLGIDAAATGAETAQIERDAYVILALGDRQQVDPETVSWKLSVAKYRLGTADLVHELHYRGRVGIWEIVGEARTATDVRESRTSEMKQKKKDELKRSITMLLTESPKPLSQKDIIDLSTGKDSTIKEAIKELLREGALEHVHGTRKGGHALIWVPAKLTQEGAKC